MTPERLTECRKIMGWTTEWLAHAVGRSRKQVHRWVNGAPIPDEVNDWLEALVAYYKRNPPPTLLDGRTKGAKDR